MQREVVITIDDEIYEGLERRAGPEGVGGLIERLVRPLLVAERDLDLEAGYLAMANDDEREREAAEWADALIGDAAQ